MCPDLVIVMIHSDILSADEVKITRIVQSTFYSLLLIWFTFFPRLSYRALSTHLYSSTTHAVAAYHQDLPRSTLWILTRSSQKAQRFFTTEWNPQKAPKIKLSSFATQQDPNLSLMRVNVLLVTNCSNKPTPFISCTLLCSRENPSSALRNTPSRGSHDSRWTSARPPSRPGSGSERSNTPREHTRPPLSLSHTEKASSALFLWIKSGGEKLEKKDSVAYCIR